MKELVKNINGKAVTSSRKVAEVFEKLHKNVLQAIRELEIPEDFRELNFQPSEYEVQNSIGKIVKYPEYLMTKDGFLFLVTGFNGKKAAEFKIAFINAFNEMEKTLNSLGTCSCAAEPEVEVYARPVAISFKESTLRMLDKINNWIIADIPVEEKVLQYAWNCGRLLGKELVKKQLPDDFAEFVQSIPAGRYTRKEIYALYRNAFKNPMNARWFWPRVRGIRPIVEVRDAYCYHVVFE